MDSGATVWAPSYSRGCWGFCLYKSETPAPAGVHCPALSPPLLPTSACPTPLFLDVPQAEEREATGCQLCLRRREHVL